MILQILIIFVLSLFIVTSPAKAGPEYWQAFDFKIPFSKTQRDIWRPDAFHIFTLAQVTPRQQGLGFIRFSSGPMWKFSKSFILAFHADLIGIKRNDSTFINETRFDIEPIFKGEWQDWLYWLNRNSMEYRLFPTFQRIRFRSLIRFNFKTDLYHWTPYVANEFFFELPERSLNQNRLISGISYHFSKTQHLDLGYMFRLRKDLENDWSQDHILMLFYFY